jgi:glycerophosphoryl diester phosphodiesterase
MSIALQLEVYMKYIAHRGLSTKAPENTIPAFTLAAQEQRFYGIECDIQTTKDHQFVIFHDEDLHRMAKAKVKVRDLNYDELQAFQIKKGKKIKSYMDLKIPLLTEFLDICSFFNKAAIIEIKYVHDITVLTDLVNMLDQYMGVKVIFISFNLSYLKYIRAISTVELHFLSDKFNEDQIYDLRVNTIDVSLNKDLIKKNLVSRLRKEGFKIGVYTVNDSKEALKMQQFKIDYLTTDK